jgi:hypothetical protein
MCENVPSVLPILDDLGKESFLGKF